MSRDGGPLIALGAAGVLAGLAVLGGRSRRGARNDEGDGWWYHATSIEALEEIEGAGLVPTSGSNFGGGYAGHSRGRVFFTEGSGGSYWADKVEQRAHHSSDFDTEESFGLVPVVLRVGRQDLAMTLGEPEADELGTRDAGHAEAVFFQGEVPPDLIEVWDGQAWVSLDDGVDTASMRDEVGAAAQWEQDDDLGWWEIDFDVLLPLVG